METVTKHSTLPDQALGLISEVCPIFLCLIKSFLSSLSVSVCVARTKCQSLVRPVCVSAGSVLARAKDACAGSCWSQQRPLCHLLGSVRVFNFQPLGQEHFNFSSYWEKEAVVWERKVKESALAAEVGDHSLYARCQLLLDVLQPGVCEGWGLLANLKVVQTVRSGPWAWAGALGGLQVCAGTSRETWKCEVHEEWMCEPVCLPGGIKQE